MAKRPIHVLVDALRGLGADVACPTGCPPLTIRGGRLRGGRVRMRGDQSSQYLSALLMAAGFADADLDVEIEGSLVSRPYVDITRRMIAGLRRRRRRDAGRIPRPRRAHAARARLRHRARRILGQLSLRARGGARRRGRGAGARTRCAAGRLRVLDDPRAGRRRGDPRRDVDPRRTAWHAARRRRRHAPHLGHGDDAGRNRSASPRGRRGSATSPTSASRRPTASPPTVDRAAAPRPAGDARRRLAGHRTDACDAGDGALLRRPPHRDELRHPRRGRRAASPSRTRPACRRPTRASSRISPRSTPRPASRSSSDTTTRTRIAEMCYMWHNRACAPRVSERLRQNLTSLLDDVRKGRRVVISDRDIPWRCSCRSKRVKLFPTSRRFAGR